MIFSGCSAASRSFYLDPYPPAKDFPVQTAHGVDAAWSRLDVLCLVWPGGAPLSSRGARQPSGPSTSASTAPRFASRSLRGPESCKWRQTYYAHG